MPLSGDKKARAKQLANVRPAPPAPRGNRRRLTHGGEAQHPKRQAVLERQITDALPVREPDGSAPKADKIAVALLALTVARLESCARYVTTHGQFTKTGKVHPAVAVEEKLTVRARELAGELGLTPAARSRIGLTLKQTEHLDLAQLLSDAPDARTPRLKRTQLPDIDGTASND